MNSDIVNTTLCYIEKNGSYLMLHRTKKPGDYNRDKWIGIGGKFESGESPEDCVIREVREETGLVIPPRALQYCGLVTFVDLSEEPPYTELMHIFRAREFSGELLSDCDEGVLEWVSIARMNELPHWKGDEIFLDFLAQERPLFSLKLVYKNGNLLRTELGGEPYEHWE